jgi:hypothetical protein
MTHSSYLLFPGRHLVNTRFQQEYLGRALRDPVDSLPGAILGRVIPAKPYEVIFAITSSNQENSRFLLQQRGWELGEGLLVSGLVGPYRIFQRQN